jgi:Tol biopolymer transport system component
MFIVPDHSVRSLPLVRRIGFVPTVVALLAAATLAACGGDSEDDTPPAPEPSGVTETASPSPSASPLSPSPLTDGELIVFERSVPGAEERDLYVVGPDRGEPTLLRSSGSYPDWSPDGGRLAFLACLNPPDCTTAVALMERATGEIVGFPMPDSELYTPCPIWSPSGAELACEGTSEVDQSRNGIYIIRATDGQGLTRMTRNPNGLDHPLAYSPDGGRLLFDRTDPSRAGSADQALFVTPTSGGQVRRITPWGYSDDYASWSPDGRTIVFGTDGSLYRVSPEGQGLAEITLEMPEGSSALGAFDVSFSPDGQRIVFSLSSPVPGIYTARPDGSDVVRLTDGQDHHANWGPQGS